MIAWGEHLLCPTWARPFRCRFSQSFDQALRDWIPLVYGAFDAMSEGDELWKPFRRPRIQWDPSRSPNGYVTIQHDDTPVIATTLGVYHGVHAFLYRLFSTSDLVVQIGDSSHEKGNLAQRARSLRWLRDPEGPTCPVRLEASHIAAECAIALVFYHEAAHVILGHVPTESRGKSFQERGRRSWNSVGTSMGALPPYAAQLQEIQADRCAIAIAFEHVRKAGGCFPNQIVRAELKSVLPDLIMIAQVALHIVLADATLEMKAITFDEHPHPLTRFIDAIGSQGRVGHMEPSRDVSAIADAFRLAALLRRKRITPEVFDRLQKDAREQHQRILESASTDNRVDG